MILLTIKFPNRSLTTYYDLEDSDSESPCVVVGLREIDEKRFELRLHLDQQKILDPTDLQEYHSYQGSLSSSDIVAQEIECD